MLFLVFPWLNLFCRDIFTLEHKASHPKTSSQMLMSTQCASLHWSHFWLTAMWLASSIFLCPLKSIHCRNVGEYFHGCDTKCMWLHTSSVVSSVWVNPSGHGRQKLLSCQSLSSLGLQILLVRGSFLFSQQHLSNTNNNNAIQLHTEMHRFISSPRVPAARLILGFLSDNLAIPFLLLTDLNKTFTANK